MNESNSTKNQLPEYNVEDITPEAVEQDNRAFENEKLLMARTLYGEARGEGPEGMEAVANSIRNRVHNSNYPPNYTGVIRKPKQYSIWNDPNSNLYRNLEALQPNTGNASFDKAYEIAGKIMDEEENPYTHDTTGSLIDADHYLNPVKTARGYESGKIPDSHWSKHPKMKLQGVLGNHHFYKDESRPPSGFATGKDRYKK